MVKHRRLSQKHPAFVNGAAKAGCAVSLAHPKATATQSTGISRISSFRCPVDMEAME